MALYFWPIKHLISVKISFSEQSLNSALTLLKIALIPSSGCIPITPSSPPISAASAISLPQLRLTISSVPLSHYNLTTVTLSSLWPPKSLTSKLQVILSDAGETSHPLLYTKPHHPLRSVQCPQSNATSTCLPLTSHLSSLSSTCCLLQKPFFAVNLHSIGSHSFSAAASMGWNSIPDNPCCRLPASDQVHGQYLPLLLPLTFTSPFNVFNHNLPSRYVIYFFISNVAILKVYLYTPTFGGPHDSLIPIFWILP